MFQMASIHRHFEAERLKTCYLSECKKTAFKYSACYILLYNLGVQSSQNGSYINNKFKHSI
jgi:hypothetical protein